MQKVVRVLISLWLCWLATWLPAQGRVMLIYEIPVETLQRGNPALDLEKALTGAIATIAERVGPSAKVERAGAAGFTVTLSSGDVEALRAVRGRVESLGQLQMCIVASDGYSAEHVRFCLADERARLRAWLGAGNREKVLADPAALDQFHAAKENGPVAGVALRWFVHRVHADAREAGRWQTSFHESDAMRDACVPLFTASDWNDGKLPVAWQKKAREERVLIELVALNMHERRFTNADLDPARCGPIIDASGRTALAYQVRGNRASDYAEWSEKYIGHCAALVWNGDILAAPRFVSRIPGNGIFSGDFSKEEVDVLCRCIVSGPLPVVPQLLETKTLAK